MWGTWYEREEEFFRACASRVAALSWTDVRRIGGERIAVLERLASRALSRLNRIDIPEPLRHVGLPGSVFHIVLPTTAGPSSTQAASTCNTSTTSS